MIKMAIYCPQGSGTLRQQLLSVHGIVWYCMVLRGIEWYCMVLHVIAWYCMALHGIFFFNDIFGFERAGPSPHEK